MAVREGKMDVQVLYEPGLIGVALLQSIADAVDAKLAMSGERLVRLLTDRVTLIGGGGGENPWRVAKDVPYRAEPITLDD